MIDRYMNIACEDNWYKYISKAESVVMDSATDFTDSSNNPSRGLELSEKANARKKRDMHTKPSEKDINKVD